jgi:hypothetical protein
MCSRTIDSWASTLSLMYKVPLWWSTVTRAGQPPASIVRCGVAQPPVMWALQVRVS